MSCGLLIVVLDDGSVMVTFDDGSGGDSRVFEGWTTAREYIAETLDNWHEEK